MFFLIYLFKIILFACTRGNDNNISLLVSQIYEYELFFIEKYFNDDVFFS